MTEPDPLLKVLREHFPGADIPDCEGLFTNEFIDDETRLSVAHWKEQEAELKNLEARLKAAQVAYLSLHPEVRRALDARFRANSVARLGFAPGTTLVVEGDPAQRAAHLSNVLQATLWSLTGEPGGWGRDRSDKQPSALNAARETVRALVPMTGKARKEGSWSKVALVEHAIRTWERYGSGKPRLYSNAFAALLNGLAEALGRKEEDGWSARELVEAHKHSRRTRKKLG